jgi:hypothetical protein
VVILPAGISDIALYKTSQRARFFRSLRGNSLICGNDFGAQIWVVFEIGRNYREKEDFKPLFLRISLVTGGGNW